MAQFILNITDEKKAFKLFEFLQTLNYIQVQELTEENIPISESEKMLMRDRQNEAKEDDFKDWSDIKGKYNVE